VVLLVSSHFIFGNSANTVGPWKPQHGLDVEVFAHFELILNVGIVQQEADY
jgi:hypothetical protein